VEPEPVAKGKEVARNAEGGLTLPGLQELSRRQREVISLVLQGLTAREIGVRLFISERTVETHVANAYERLNVRSRPQLLSACERPDVHSGQKLVAYGSPPAAAALVP